MPSPTYLCETAEKTKLCEIQESAVTVAHAQKANILATPFINSLSNWITAEIERKETLKIKMVTLEFTKRNTFLVDRRDTCYSGSQASWLPTDLWEVERL